MMYDVHRGSAANANRPNETTARSSPKTTRTSRSRLRLRSQAAQNDLDAHRLGDERAAEEDV